MTRVEGWISIRELRCTGHQGATALERRRLNEYLVDVAVRGDLGPALERDELSAAFDIAALAQVTRQAVAERPRTLIERIAGDVARATFARFPQEDISHQRRLRFLLTSMNSLPQLSSAQRRTRACESEPSTPAAERQIAHRGRRVVWRSVTSHRDA